MIRALFSGESLMRLGAERGIEEMLDEPPVARLARPRAIVVN
jgi:hypothetical protein